MALLIFSHVPITSQEQFCDVQERNKGGKIPQEPNHYGGDEWLRGAPKSPNNVTSTFFNTVHLLPKDLRYEHGGAKLASYHGSHLTSLHPWWCHTDKKFERDQGKIKTIGKWTFPGDKMYIIKRIHCIIHAEAFGRYEYAGKIKILTVEFKNKLARLWKYMSIGKYKNFLTLTKQIISLFGSTDICE